MDNGDPCFAYELLELRHALPLGSLQRFEGARSNKGVMSVDEFSVLSIEIVFLGSKVEARLLVAAEACLLKPGWTMENNPQFWATDEISNILPFQTGAAI